MIEVLFFSAPWCSACKTAKPVVEAAAKESGYTFRYIDIEENSTNSKLSAKMDVSSLPTSVILKDGKERSPCMIPTSMSIRPCSSGYEP